MDLNNSFEVDADREAAWVVLNDVERIAPCLPGAQLTEIEGEEFRGTVKVKVGPVTAQYNGQAVFVERDKDAGRVVLKGDGRDSRDAGNASALITATLHEVTPTTTRVDVHTDLSITGKVAQFGRGVIADVSTNLMGQFADNLQELLAKEPVGLVIDEPAAAESVEGEGPAIGEAPAAEGPRRIDSPEVEAVDLLDAAGAPLFKRVLPVIGVLALLLMLRRLLRRRD